MAQISPNVGAGELVAGASVLSRPADEFVNDPSLEAVWVSKAVDHAEVYFNILCSVDPKILRLTAHDDFILKTFREQFPDMKVDVLIEDEMKSPEGKVKWREFCEKFKDVVEDYNFGTLLRLDSKGEYSEENTMLSTRIQFYAIELARNKEGLNDSIRNNFKPSRTKKS
uniref:Protein PBDC1 n=1 Tax=Cacopsylla melanoneura TaxID=428564 RepID=A0A8D8UN51_9HEMI